MSLLNLELPRSSWCTVKVRNQPPRLHKMEEQRNQTSIFKKMQVILLTQSTRGKKKTNNMGIRNYKAQNSFLRRKNMIHTSKDAQATAAICSWGPNSWKSTLRGATTGLSGSWTLFYPALLLHKGQKFPLRSKEQVCSKRQTCSCVDLRVTTQTTSTA